MESDEVRRQLHEAERAEAAPWTEFPPTPAWYPAAVGLWAALLVLGISLLGHLTAPWWGAACIAVAVLGQIGFLRWYRRFRGTMPAGHMPAELHAPARSLVVGLVGIAVVVAVGIAFTPAWLPAVVAFVLVSPLVWWYERAYAGAMADARSRLA